MPSVRPSVRSGSDDMTILICGKKEAFSWPTVVVVIVSSSSAFSGGKGRKEEREDLKSRKVSSCLVLHFFSGAKRNGSIFCTQFKALPLAFVVFTFSSFLPLVCARVIRILSGF